MRRSQIFLLLVGLLGACDSGPAPEQLAVSYLLTWFEQAEQGMRDDELCHGLGLLKHPTYTCADYLQSAANITLSSRGVAAVTPMDCYQDICGTFFQIEVDGVDKAGNESREIVLIKQDADTMRVYWYRSEEMLQDLRRAEEIQREADKDPVQVAYDELTNQYPTLYAYPPCIDVRPSSNTLLAPPIALQDINPAELDLLADECSGTVCIGTVGRKYALLCKTD